MKVKKLFSIVCLFIITGVCFAFGAQGFSVAQAQSETVNLITTRDEFNKAFADAKDGDTLLVGDIDFNLQATGAVNEAERLKIDKSVVIKNGKAEGNAVFTGASFILNGTKIAGESTTFVFKGIKFDEKLNTETLTNADWELAYDGAGEKISSYPLKNQYAIECRGNTNATFEDCEFVNYMHTYGSAIRAFYADYTLTPTLELEHGNNVMSKLELTLIGCDFRNNASLYAGGAIYVDAGSKNVTVSATDCIFDNNKSGLTNNSVGGGAICLKSAIGNFEECTFTKNNANYDYGGEKPFADQLSGGAIYCSLNSVLNMINSTIAGNRSSYGGGIAMIEQTVAHIEGCVITENQAIPGIDNSDGNFGLCSNKGIGGGVYINGDVDVTISNTEICCNYAENAMGGIFVYYTPSVSHTTNLELYFCTIADNNCGFEITEYFGYGEDRWFWYSWHDDFFSIPYINAFGCFVVDDVYETDIPRYETPTEENHYNYFGSSSAALEDGYIVAAETEHGYGHVQPRNTQTVPTELVKERLGDKNYYGMFTVGANVNDVTFKFFVDGECKEQVTLGSGELPTLPEFTKDGYTLTGWELAQEMDYQEDRTLIVGNATPSVDVYAIFTPNVYTVTYNFGGMTKEVEQTYGEEIELPEIIEKSNHSFMGFYTQEDGKGTKITSGMKFENVGDITYYAFYKEEFPMFEVIISCVALVLILGVGTMALIMYKRRHRQPVLDAVDGAPMDEVKPAPDTSMLSPREKEVLELLLQGKQRNEIATTLYISENTVKKNISGIYTKLNVSSKAELFALFK